MAEVIKKEHPVNVIKGYLREETIKKRFDEILGQKAPHFIASIVNVVTGSKSLQDCEPSSVISSAFIAASLDLPIDPNLGFAAIVPYNCKDGNKAQFQMCAKGFIQLAIRTNSYEKMNYAEVYEDELIEYNPITKEVDFVKFFSPEGQRAKNQTEKIIGYFAWFVTKQGYRQGLYMTVKEIEAHASKYSRAYQYDKRENRKTSQWSKDFDSMAKKTVIKLLLSKWGLLSIEMQKAITDDQKIDDDYLDSPATEAKEAQIEMPKELKPTEEK